MVLKAMRSRWQDWTNLAFAAWLFLSPFILQYATVGGAAWNAYVVSVAIAVFTVIALFAPKVWEEWINLLLGVWLVVSPWLLQFSSHAFAAANMVIVGLAVIIIAGSALPRSASPVGR